MLRSDIVINNMKILYEVIEKIYELKKENLEMTVSQKLLKAKYKNKILYFRKYNAFYDNKEEITYSRLNSKNENIEKYISYINDEGIKFYKDLN